MVADLICIYFASQFYWKCFPHSHQVWHEILHVSRAYSLESVLAQTFPILLIAWTAGCITTAVGALMLSNYRWYAAVSATLCWQRRSSSVQLCQQLLPTSSIRWLQSDQSCCNVGLSRVRVSATLGLGLVSLSRICIWCGMIGSWNGKVDGAAVIL